MKKLIRFFFSMSFNGVLLLVFAFTIGLATFIESSYGTPAAQSLAYRATWFEILLFMVALGLAGNIFIAKLYRKGKFPIFLFHLAVIVILAGSAITRYVGFEGIVHVREGESTNTLLTEKSYLMYKLKKGGKEEIKYSNTLFSKVSDNRMHQTLEFDGAKYQVNVLRFVPNAAEQIVPDMNGAPMMNVVFIYKGNPISVFFNHQQVRQIENDLYAFNVDGDSTATRILFKNSQLVIRPQKNIKVKTMGADSAEVLLAGKEYPFEVRKLYQLGDMRFVLQDFREKASLRLISQEGQDLGVDGVEMEVSDGKTTIPLNLIGGKGLNPEYRDIRFGKTNISLAYGSMPLELPFEITLNHFILERYPGSMTPASYTSEVTVVNAKENTHFDTKIFMNNILDYKGYRLFQMSFDKDEKGTILSVNHDYWGTFVSYLGYILLTIGMIWSLFAKKSYFQYLGLKAKAARQKREMLFPVLILGLLLSCSSISAQEVKKFEPKHVSKEHAAKFGEVLVQDKDGRYQPINTLAGELLRKVVRRSTFMNLTSDQVMLSMVLFPEDWQAVRMIKASDPELMKVLGINEKLAAMTDFFDTQGNKSYKLGSLVEKAIAKEPAHRNHLDKELIDVDERLNICYMAFSGEFLKIFPLVNDSSKKFYSVTDQSLMKVKDKAVIIGNLLNDYFVALKEAVNSGDYKGADGALDKIKKYQREIAGAYVPSESKVAVELSYNKMNLFASIYPFYLLIGFTWVVLIFMTILKPGFKAKKTQLAFYWLLAALFAVHTLGLLLRWYIAEHAPWSNGYESMVYVAWATMLAGLLFARKNPMTVSLTALLAGIILFVAHLSWMNPEVTMLVPVLKSYWLMIHVAIITASYGFIGLGALIGLANLILAVLRKPENKDRINLVIDELSCINNQTVILGVYFLSIGTYLGGVWANESWGRYWGWDPKETWALVTILVYAFILHLRLIPGMASRLTYNFASVIGFSSVIMTYLGVNYYLAGMHSYGKTDAIPIPSVLMIVMVVIIFIAAFAYRNESKLGSTEIIEPESQE